MKIHEEVHVFQLVKKVLQCFCLLYTSRCVSETVAEQDEEKYKDMFREMGITVVEFTDEERASFAKACHEIVWPKLANTFTQEFLDGCLADAQAE